MAISPRLRALCYWYVLLAGVTELCGALFLQVTVMRVTLGILYIVSAAYMLTRTKRSPANLPALQRVN